MFEITPQDVAQLDDTQLRTLVALLCEADLRGRGYPTAAVTWGGDQNAKDGGLDVRVSLQRDKPIDGFIPRPATGFQVKKQDMPPRAIAGEMCPKGELRPAIRQLAEDGGAYIIVSSEGSTADIALTKRMKAMADALAGLDDQIAFDFYDRTRLATWIRSHAGLVVWTRRAIGRAIPGWEPYGAWAYPAGGTEAGYLSESDARVRDRTVNSSDDMSVEEGLKKIRGILRSSARVVRLVGLSGVGKTRFVQALFDERIGEEALDPALAIYTNMSNEPNPQPFSLASDLIANGTRAILLVDNCASELHARLAALVGSTASPVSVLTIEYDIQDDLPEGTDVFEIRAASINLIEQLLRSRFPKLSQIDARTAAEFSGGNARIAIALADTVGRGGTLARLNDTQLFERLFFQRQGQDRSLFETAQACALVYSFNGEDISDDEEAEMARIAGLIGGTADQVHRDVAELLRRDLAQRRGKWRAILPHALANRIAATALQNIPYARIQQYLVNGAPQRLTISLSRRLGYLDSSKEAASIVRDWLGTNGWIGEHIWNLNEFGSSMLRNSLPAEPEAGLRALEVNLLTLDADTPITSGDYLPRLLRSLAWGAALFDRCTALLQVIAIRGEERIAKEAHEIHTSLFSIYLSGTHATSEQRASVVRNLIGTDGAMERGLGIAALRAMLQCNYFTSHHDFQFGAHSRDYGYAPSTYDEMTHWYRAAFAVAEEFASTGNAAANEVNNVISMSFRGLWTQVGLRDELENVAARFAAQGFWSDGWLAVKQTRFYDEKDKASENYARLTKLEEMLRPRNLVECVRGKVFASSSYDVDGIGAGDAHNFHLAIEQRQAEVKSLGSDVASDSAALTVLMPEIVGGKGDLWEFGMGLAQGTKEPMQLWRNIVEQFEVTPQDRRDTRALGGFLFELSSNDSPLLNELLDEALENEPLAPYFPSLQTSTPFTPLGMTRLIRSLDIGKAPIQMYANVQLGRAVEVVPGADIAAFITSISKAIDGEPVAIQLLSTQFFTDLQDKRAHTPAVVEAGRTVLQTLNFDQHSWRHDYHLHGVVAVCGAGDEGYRVVKTLCENFRLATIEHKISGFDHDQLLKALLKVQPKAVLDALLTGNPTAVSASVRLIDQSSHRQQNPMDEVSESTLLKWCSEDPVNRYPAVASVVSVFTLTADQNPSAWSPVAARLVHGAPDPLAVMGAFVARLRPMMWSGSRSTILQTNAMLLVS
ncbi:hypothetical protein [Caballeronia sp. KNU42]